MDQGFTGKTRQVGDDVMLHFAARLLLAGRVHFPD